MLTKAVTFATPYQPPSSLSSFAYPTYRIQPKLASQSDLQLRLIGGKQRNRSGHVNFGTPIRLAMEPAQQPANLARNRRHLLGRDAKRKLTSCQPRSNRSRQAFQIDYDCFSKDQRASGICSYPVLAASKVFINKTPTISPRKRRTQGERKRWRETATETVGGTQSVDNAQSWHRLRNDLLGSQGPRAIIVNDGNVLVRPDLTNQFVR